MSDKPVRWNCPCGVKFQIGAETQIHGYHRQPWLSHIVVACPSCNDVFVRFLPPQTILEAVTGMSQDDKCFVAFTDFAEDGVVMEFAKQNNLPYVPSDCQSKPVVPRLEKTIAFFHYLLEHGEVPDGLDEAV